MPGDDPVVLPNLKAKAIDVPRYSGDLIAPIGSGRLGCLEWVPLFETFKNQNAWNDTAAITNASLCFVGEAQMWWVAQNRHITKNDWAAFKKEFNERFLRVQTPAERKALMDTLRQGFYQREESVTAWFDRCCYFHEMMGAGTEDYPQAYQAMTAAHKTTFRNTLTDTRIKDSFVSGLRKDIGKIVTTSAAKTIKELVHVAAQAEATLREQNRGKNPYIANTVQEGAVAAAIPHEEGQDGAAAAPTPTPITMEGLTNMVNGAVNKQFQRYNDRGRGGGGRFQGQRGRGGRGGGRGRPSTYRPSAEHPCANCGSAAHWKNECPQPSRLQQGRGGYRGGYRGRGRGQAAPVGHQEEIWDEWEGPGHVEQQHTAATWGLKNQ